MDFAFTNHAFDRYRQYVSPFSLEKEALLKIKDAFSSASALPSSEPEKEYFLIQIDSKEVVLVLSKNYCDGGKVVKTILLPNYNKVNRLVKFQHQQARRKVLQA